MDKWSFLGSADNETIEALYQQYKQDPQSVDSSWAFFFSGFEFAKTQDFISEGDNTKVHKEFKVINYINAYRRRGHLFTKTNPVRTRRSYTPSLDLTNYELENEDLQSPFQAATLVGLPAGSTLQEIVDFLEETYCRSVGVEYLFIRKPEKTVWLEQRIEGSKNQTGFKTDEKKQIFQYLAQAVGFEQFLQKKFVGQKRFSLEGSEALIPALHYVMLSGSNLGLDEYMIGMAHRGRLNVLGNIMQKPYENIFQEFIAEEYEDDIALGDVKYHLGYDNTITLENDKSVKVHLAPNPSHLETVAPIIQGLSRSHIENKYHGDFTKLLPIVIHGDAAIAGQGVVYEVVQMAELPGYKTGGSLHIVINNQVGFTTNYLDARTSTYCTDVAKVTKCPIFHVNGDDVEALVHVINLAIEYRQNFYTDVFIDILSYRKYGHNEGDEPRYTQPTLYKAIAKHPSPRDVYRDQLIAEGVYDKKGAQAVIDAFEEDLEDKLEASKSMKKVRIQPFLNDLWKDYKHARRDDFDEPIESEISKELLLFLGEKINTLRDDEKFINKTNKLVDDRKKMMQNEQLDWAMAELLAYGSVVYQGHPIRISGQDVVRGTFAHRHAAHTIENTDKKFTPLKYVREGQGSFHIYNSPLNEYGVLGFEYGYALGTPKGLNIWEAQFGDFANVAQVIFDQYVFSAEEKWGLMNGLTVLLPHGFEGQGPEHSSARLERFLSLAARNNVQISMPTTPASMFHLLRQQVYRKFRVPLIVFTPKSLLRHPKCLSSLDELAEGSFQPVIDDENVDIEKVKRVVFCSGKVYYDLLGRKEKHNARDVALVRLEQLHPFPKKEVDVIIEKYYNNMLTLWVQEEPINMGAWRHVQDEFTDIEILPIARMASGSPATGLAKIHAIQQQEILSKVFRECVCELQNEYCGLNCPDGALREKILKQYKYFWQESQNV